MQKSAIITLLLLLIPPTASHGETRFTKEDLEEQFLPVFGTKEDSISTKRLTLQELKDDKVFDQIFNLRYNLGILVDAGVYLDGFEAYGVKAIDNNSVEINTGRHLRWITLDDVVTTICMETQLQSFLRRLAELGFTKAEKDIVKAHCLENTLTLNSIYNSLKGTPAENPSKPVYSYYVPLIKAEPDDVKADTLIKTYLYEAALTGRVFHQAFAKAYFDWAVNLLNKFDSSRQEIIVSILVEVPSKTSITRTETEEYRKYLRKSILAGEY